MGISKNMKKPHNHTKNISLYNEDGTETQDETQTTKKMDAAGTRTLLQNNQRKPEHKNRTH